MRFETESCRRLLSVSAIAALLLLTGIPEVSALTDPAACDPPFTREQVRDRARQRDDPSMAGELLLSFLSERYDIELSVLESFVEEGYTPGQLRIALQLAADSAKTLEEILARAGGSEDPRWGQVAFELGLRPGVGGNPGPGPGVGEGQGGPGPGPQAGDGEGGSGPGPWTQAGEGGPGPGTQNREGEGNPEPGQRTREGEGGSGGRNKGGH